MGIKGPNKARAREIQHPRDVPCDQNPSLRQMLYAYVVDREEKEKKERRSRGKKQNATNVLPAVPTRDDDPNRLPKQGLYFKKKSLQAAENAQLQRDSMNEADLNENSSSAQHTVPTWQSSQADGQVHVPPQEQSHLRMLATANNQPQMAQDPAAPQAYGFPAPSQPQNRWFTYAQPVASPTGRVPPVASPVVLVPLVATAPRVDDRPRQPGKSHVPPPSPVFKLQNTPAKPVEDSDAATVTGSGDSGDSIATVSAEGNGTVLQGGRSANKNNPRNDVDMSTDTRPQLPKASLPEKPRYNEGLMRFGEVYPSIPAGDKQTASPVRPKSASKAAAGAQQKSSGKTSNPPAANNGRTALPQRPSDATPAHAGTPSRKPNGRQTLPKTNIAAAQSKTATKAARKNTTGGGEGPPATKAARKSKPNGGESTPATNKKVNGGKAPAGNSKKKDADAAVASREARVDPSPFLNSIRHTSEDESLPAAKTSGPKAAAGNKQQNKANKIDKARASLQPEAPKGHADGLASGTEARTTGAAGNSVKEPGNGGAEKTADPATEQNIPSAHEADTAVAESLLQLATAPVKGKKKAGPDKSTAVGRTGLSAADKNKPVDGTAIAHKENTKAHAAGDNTTPEVDKVTAHDGGIVMIVDDSDTTLPVSSPAVPATNGSINAATTNNRHLSLDLAAGHSPESSPEPELRTPHGTRSMSLEPSNEPSFDPAQVTIDDGDSQMLDPAEPAITTDIPATSKEHAHSIPRMPGVQSEGVDVLMSSLSITSVAVNNPGAQQSKGKRKEHPATEPGPVPWTQAKKTRTASALIFKAIGMASRNASAKDRAVLDRLEKAWENLFEDE